MSKRMHPRGSVRGRTRAWPLAIAIATVLACALDHVRHEPDEPRTDPRAAFVAAAGASGVPLVRAPAAMTGIDRRAASETGVLAMAGATRPRLEERAPDELVAQALGRGTAEDRAAALDALAYAAPAGSGQADYVRSTLVQALTDPDEPLRAQALATLKDTVPDLPAQAVVQVARNDPDPALRVQALELLAERSGDAAVGELRLALADPEPLVHDRAQELIDDMHAALQGDR